MSRAIRILMVEDNPADVIVMYEMLMDAKVPVVIDVVKDGRRALDVLKKEMVFGAPSQDLVVLDLNMPRIDGFEVLREVRATPGLRDLPVVVMTGSSNPEDEARARRLGATDYRVKPVTIGDMGSTVQWLKDRLVPMLEHKAVAEPNSQGKVPRLATVGGPTAHSKPGPGHRPPSSGGPLVIVGAPGRF